MSWESKDDNFFDAMFAKDLVGYFEGMLHYFSQKNPNKSLLQVLEICDETFFSKKRRHILYEICFWGSERIFKHLELNCSEYIQKKTIDDSRTVEVLLLRIIRTLPINPTKNDKKTLKSCLNIIKALIQYGASLSWRDSYSDTNGNANVFKVLENVKSSYKSPDVSIPITEFVNWCEENYPEKILTMMADEMQSEKPGL